MTREEQMFLLKVRRVLGAFGKWKDIIEGYRGYLEDYEEESLAQDMMVQDILDWANVYWQDEAHDEVIRRLKGEELI